MSDELSEIIETLVIHPGDTLIVRVPSRVDVGSAHRLMAMLKERLPVSVNVAVIAAEQLAVFRPDPEPKPIETIPLEAKRRP